MSDNGTMVFRLYIPRNYSTQYRYPLVMCLHGIGECGTDGRVQIDREYMDHQWMLDSVKSKYKPFVFYPQCPSSSYEWGYFNTGTAAQKGYAGIPAVAAVKVIDSLCRVFPIDTTRLYVGGLSWGGLGTEALMMSYPNKFAAAFPCAGENYLNTVSVMIKTPFWIFHGASDGIVPVAPDRNLVNNTITAGTPVVKFYSGLTTGSPPFNIINITGVVTLDSLGRAVAGGSQYLYSEINGGDHGSGWHEPFYHTMLVPWLMSKSKVNGQIIFTWPAPGPRTVTSVFREQKASPPLSGKLRVANGMVRWKGVLQLPARIDIYSAKGTLVIRHSISQRDGALVCSGLAKGVFFVDINSRDWSERKIMAFF